MSDSSDKLSSSSIVRRPGGRSARVADAVLRATLETFAEGGWDAVRIDDIAARADVHKTTIYRRWPTRGVLIAAALSAMPFRAPNALAPDTGSLRGDLLALTTETAAMMREDRTRQIIRRLAEAQAAVPELGHAMHDFWTSRIELTRAVVLRARRRGEIPSGIDAGVVATMFAGAAKLRVTELDMDTPHSWYVKLVDATVRAAGAAP